MIGHSLGAATAEIVGARKKIKSFGMEPPGLIYSSLKFGINEIQPIYDTSTSLIRDGDVVTLVDKQGGEVQHLTCPSSLFSLKPSPLYCHLPHPITCHLMTNCQAMNNAAFNFWGGGANYCPQIP